MDLTIVNEASDEELLSQLMEVDLYEISYRRTTLMMLTIFLPYMLPL